MSLYPQKKGISVEWVRGETYKVTKAKGRLTVEEIQEAMANEGHEGMIVIAVPVGDSGWVEEESKGDAVDVHVTWEGDDCPLCRKTIPPYLYCPECGHRLREGSE